MKTYYIYHIPGKKIGVSLNPKKRVNDQGYTSFEIIETHDNIYEVSERERELQKQFGYKIDNNPYWMSIEKRKLAGKSGGHTGGKIGGRMHVDSGHLQSISAKGGSVSSNIIKTCQYCGTVTNTLNHGRWHGDKCKNRDTIR